MKKNTIKAFTLVEMLIVIVIIGILIASLMPRMQSAQGRARDVARKNDLSQIQTAIITSQQDKKTWPAMASTWATTKASEGIPVGDISELLINAGMTQTPTDPNKSNKFKGLGATEVKTGNYGYMVTKRNAVANGGFVLMAKTEVEGSSNWIVCESGHTAGGTDALKAANLTGKGWFDTGVDLKYVKTCTSFVKDTTTNNTCSMSDGVCTYSDEAQLRYVLVY